MDALEVAACRLAIGEQPPEALPKLATDALGRGVDSPSLRQVAGMDYEDVDDIRDVFIAALGELGHEIPGEQAALWSLVRHMAMQIVDGQILPYDGACWIWRSAYPRIQREGDLRVFVGLASEWEDHPHLRAAFDGDIVEAAREVLSRSHPRAWLKVMAAQGRSPLWDPKGHENLDVRVNDIPGDLRAELLRWAADYDATFEPADNAGFDSADDAVSFVRRGEQLVVLLQAELGSDWHVEYMPEPIQRPGLRLRQRKFRAGGRAR